MIFRLCFVKFYENRCSNIKYHKLNKEKYIATSDHLTEFCNRQHPYKNEEQKEQRTSGFKGAERLQRR